MVPTEIIVRKGCQCGWHAKMLGIWGSEGKLLTDKLELGIWAL